MALFFWLICLFLLGAIVGSFLNVCIFRIPVEKSILWPPSMCGQCLQPIRWYDNVPLLSYVLLRGRCRRCGARFSIRYFLIELLTGLGVAGLFYLEVGAKNPGPLLVPNWQWLIFGCHTVLFCLLVVTSFCDLDHQEIPLPVTVTGTLVGLLGGTILWPYLPATARWVHAGLPTPDNLMLELGIYLWPVWPSLPGWLPETSRLTGLVTGLAGALAGMLLLRGLRFTFGIGRGKEGLGLGDADLMMMAGSFLGWQPIVMAFLIAVFPGLVFGIIHLVLRGNKSLPFGPALAMGVIFTWLRWDRIAPPFQIVFFSPLVLLIGFGGGVFFLFAAGLLLRLIHGEEQPEEV